MNTNANLDIKMAILKANLKNYEVAEQVGMSEATFYRKMRTPLDEETKKEILKAIEEIGGAE